MDKNENKNRDKKADMGTVCYYMYPDSWQGLVAYCVGALLGVAIAIGVFCLTLIL